MILLIIERREKENKVARSMGDRGRCVGVPCTVCLWVLSAL